MSLTQRVADAVGGLPTRTALAEALRLLSPLRFQLDWDPSSPSAVVVGCTTEDVPTLQAVVASSQRSILLLERVAAASQRGYRRSKALQAQLEDETLPAGIVAESQAMKRVVSQVRAVAALPTTVLITGESGTGKEVIARLLHTLSLRRHKQFLAVNCAAVPHDLFETVILGHEKGAFTGANHQHRGYVERAGDGTLLLDEVGDLSSAAQAKLLRLLQEREFERVGGYATLQAKCRFVAATNRNLEAMVADGQFREDLYYRLNVFPIELAPLRGRPGDLPRLLESLVARLCKRHGRPPPEIPPALISHLARYAWPGNIRELENTLERALILSPGTVLQLPPHWPGPPSYSRSEVPSTLDGAMRACIKQALRIADGKIYGLDGAAAIVGLKPSTLQWRMKKLGINHEHFRR